MRNEHVSLITVIVLMASTKLLFDSNTTQEISRGNLVSTEIVENGVPRKVILICTRELPFSRFYKRWRSRRQFESRLLTAHHRSSHVRFWMSQKVPIPKGGGGRGANIPECLAAWLYKQMQMQAFSTSFWQQVSKLLTGKEQCMMLI